MRGVVVRGHVLVGALLAVREVLEPDVVVDEDEDCRMTCQLVLSFQGSPQDHPPHEARNSGSVSLTKGKRRMLPR